MYVGNTEKLIRAAFEEAARDDAILFIDEADTFFTDRAGAHRSWEVSRTNELLQQMEQHDGILICCTNFLHGLDKAALRRFDWKVEFKPLDQSRLLLTYQEYFGQDRPPLNEAQHLQLSRLEGTTFGDFRAVVGRFRFAAKESLTHDTLIEALASEVAYRKGDGSGRKLGFA
jgi:SpoVK/Ycf46/Vps4 family AAA+-type ATPase